MPIDNQIEKKVREVFAAAVTQDASRMESGIRAFPDDEAVTAGIRLAAAVGLYVLGDQYGARPTREELRLLATEIAASENWAGVAADEVMTYLTAALAETSFEGLLPAARFAVLTYVIGACLLSYFHRPDEKWWTYLDRAEAELEAAQ
jgi:hypothetical protein